MADPTTYDPAFSFTAFQSSDPESPFPANRVDGELFSIALAVASLVSAVMDVRRSDGALKNQIVTKESLSAQLRLGLDKPAAWAAYTEYGDYAGVFYNSHFWVARAAHRSGSVFDPTKWSDMADLSGNIVSDSGAWFGGVETPKAADYAIVSSDAGKILAADAAGAIVFTFDEAVGLGGRVFQVRNIGSGTLTLRAADGETIEGVAYPSGLAVPPGWMAVAWGNGAVMRAVLVPSPGETFRGPDSAVSGNVAVFSGAGGKTVADSGFPGSGLGRLAGSADVVKTGSYAVVPGDAGAVLVANSASPVVFTLPTLVAAAGRAFWCRNIGAGALSVAAAGGQTIEGGASLALRTGSQAIVWPAAGGWRAARFQGVVSASADALSVAAGDLVYGSAVDTLARLPKAADGQVLALSSGFPAWRHAGSPRRQTVLSGPVDANGLPAFWPGSSGSLTLTTQNLAATPIVARIAAGYDRGGEADVLVYVNENAGVVLPASQTSYVWLDAAGALGSTTLKPIFQKGGAISVTNGQHTFDIAAMRMFVGNGSAAVPVNRVFLGRAVTSGSAVTSAVCYAYRGEYVSPLTALPAANTPQTFDHNIGVPRRWLEWDYEAECTSAVAGFAVGEGAIGNLLHYSSLAVAGDIRNVMDDISAVIVAQTNSGFHVTGKGTGVFVGVSGSNFSTRQLIRRTW